jgi:hypothetical protein
VSTGNQITELICEPLSTPVQHPERGGHDMAGAAAPGTNYYRPGPNGISMDGFDHLGFTFENLTTSANTIVACFFEGSDDGVLWVDCTLSGYNCGTAALVTLAQLSATGAAGSAIAIVDWDDWDHKYVRIRVNVQNGGAGANTLAIYLHRRKV